MTRRPLHPLEYMLEIMNNEGEDPRRRDKMAIAAAPYCHPRAEHKGKKARAQEAARKAGAGSEWGDDLHYRDGRQRQ